jgi:hypothetical protein
LYYHSVLTPSKKEYMNLAAYIIYLFITYLITVRVGGIFYKNGRSYILTILKGDERLTDSINKILLAGYYLLNLGYATIMLSFWKTITTYAAIVASVSTMTGRIVLTLAIIHFINMYAIIMIGKKQRILTHHKI